MNYEEQLKSISLIAAEDLSTTGQFLFMKMTSTGILKQTASNLVTIGVLQNNPASGKAAQIGFLGVSMVEAGAIIAKGANVMSATDGQAITATTLGGPIVGIALTAAAAAGDIIAVLLRDQSQKAIVTTTYVASGAAAISILDDAAFINTTTGAQALTLEDGSAGQIMNIQMTVDGGDCVITPANLERGLTLRLTEVGSSFTLMFSGTTWKVIARDGAAIVTVTATSGALVIDADVILFDTTAGASTASLADGYVGQVVELQMTVDGGDIVITPANLAVGLTLRITEVFSSYTLEFTGTTWKVIAREGLAIVTITAATTAVMKLDVDLFIFDTTIGASTGGLAAGYPGQRVSMKMLVDGGDQVITPATFLDGTTITFDGSDSAAIVSDGTNWLVEGTPTATVA